MILYLTFFLNHTIHLTITIIKILDLIELSTSAQEYRTLISYDEKDKKALEDVSWEVLLLFFLLLFSEDFYFQRKL